MIKNFFNENNLEYQEEVSLKKYNTYRIDIKGKYLVFPKNEEELIKILQFANENNQKYLVLGNGSNIIFSMDYFDGIIIKLDKFNSITYNDNLVTVGAGYSLIKLATESIAKGLAGLEFATGIPGNVGASVAMNAGAYKSDIGTILKKATVLTPNYKIVTFLNKDLEFNYRNTFIKEHKDYYVLSATFELSTGNVEEMNEVIQERKEKRQATQPLDLPSAGSVFRNPEGNFAGALIEKLNLKGYNINGAEVSTKHANFIVNKGNASGHDIVTLIEKIQKEVKENDNIELKLEQIIIE